ncbi:hypothetical protein AX774_g6084 [Zancudomyces culisetae]|uniref:Uncharacterized protein n=1 Tax=Zancudomyces culisetae TaxID=1213189 RepID=A0A1R1PHL5_ZANCU|nr:hypothetical protein AX774_g6084 [Zancudomyces culisetae]|eukprot:OMH80471.1 hypothetical protein AX774_g6084 [Zancudomyces culisetae]
MDTNWCFYCGRHIHHSDSALYCSDNCRTLDSFDNTDVLEDFMVNLSALEKSNSKNKVANIEMFESPLLSDIYRFSPIVIPPRVPCRMSPYSPPTFFDTIRLKSSRVHV